MGPKDKAHCCCNVIPTPQAWDRGAAPQSLVPCDDGTSINVCICDTLFFAYRILYNYTFAGVGSRFAGTTVEVRGVKSLGCTQLYASGKSTRRVCNVWTIFFAVCISATSLGLGPIRTRRIYSRWKLDGMAQGLNQGYKRGGVNEEKYFTHVAALCASLWAGVFYWQRELAHHQVQAIQCCWKVSWGVQDLSSFGNS